MSAAERDTVNAVVEIAEISAVTAVEASSIMTTGLSVNAAPNVIVHDVGEPVPVVTLPTESEDPAVTEGLEPQEETVGIVPPVLEAMR